MLSVLKKLTVKSECEHTSKHLPQSLPHRLQKEFANGIQYNMKCIIRGESQTGKSALFKRLQGLPFDEKYTPTDEIQVCNIQWNYKVTDYTIKIEVWDVVDQARKKNPNPAEAPLKLECATPNQQIANVALDAQFVNVYKGANGVILVIDITKSWTFDYAQREMENIPADIPVLIVGNHCDMSHHRTVTADAVAYYAESLSDRRSHVVAYIECSMYNGFGLRMLHKWLSVPFLHLQRRSLLDKLEANEREMAIMLRELQLHQISEGADYQKFRDQLSEQRRNEAVMKSPVAPSMVVYGRGKEILPRSSTTKVKNANDISAASYTAVEVTNLMSRADVGMGAGASNVALHHVDDFMPDEYLDKSFLEDAKGNSAIYGNASRIYEELGDSEEDEEGGGGGVGEKNGYNPLVSGFEEDLDVQEDTPPSPNFYTKKEPLRGDTFNNRHLRRSPGDGTEDPTNNDAEHAPLKKEKNVRGSRKRDANEKSKSKKKPSRRATSEQQSVIGGCGDLADNELEQFLKDDNDAYEPL